MEDVYKIECPCCTTILVVDRLTGKILEQRRPILEESTGDRYQDAMKKVKDRGTMAEEKFKKIQSERHDKAAKLDALFKDSLKRAQESGDEPKKMNPFESE